MQRYVQRAGGTSSSTESRVLKLKGLPYSTREEDLRAFFEGFQLNKARAPTRLHHS